MSGIKCVCCGQEITDEDVTMCPICGWEDDCDAEAEPNEDSLMNPCSLNEARELFKKYGDNIRNHFESTSPKFTEEEQRANWEKVMGK